MLQDVLTLASDHSSAESLAEALPDTNRPRSLYVHVPFCARKCVYCAFYSEASDGETVNRYVRALVKEFESNAGLKPETVFFGGGTPSLLNLAQWREVLTAMERYDLLGAAEWTVECNPATVSREKAKLLRSFGVNRISMGVQSLDAPLLERLGRVHTRAMVFKSFDTLRESGFENINLDLMFAIPGQTLEVWEQTLAEVASMGSEHLSSYEVIYEEDTPLFRQMQAGEVGEDEDLACAMYEMLVAFASSAGYRQYEIANFARRKAEATTVAGVQKEEPLTLEMTTACRHNLNYWRGGAFVGAGPSATSYVGGCRKKNWSNTQLYCERIEAGLSPTESSETLSPLRRAGETLAFGLRMVDGWNFKEFQEVTGFELREQWNADMAELVRRGWAEVSPERFRLTARGLRFADAAAEMVLR